MATWEWLMGYSSNHGIEGAPDLISTFPLCRPLRPQIENHIYLQQTGLVKFCKANGITVTAYSPLGSKGIEKLLK